MTADAKEGLVAAIGLMSGTSMDGIDAALIWTDGVSTVRTGAALTVPYGEALRRRLRKVIAEHGAEPKAREKVAREITLAHAEAVARLLAATGIGAEGIDVIGFHGQTVFHNPAERVTIQIGDAALLAERTGIGVVAQMRLADVKAGGQGAPLVPLYHAARASQLEKPVAVLNIGGVANVTWLGADERIVAYDCGPGNALIDDFVHAKTGKLYDASGTLSLSGKVDNALLAKLLDNPYFDLPPPKSLDRNAFDASGVSALSAADGAATLAAFTVQAAARSLLKLGNPKQLLVCGGGRLNRGIMAGLAAALPDTEVVPVEKVGWRGDALEAEAFGYLAVRSLKGLPLSLPSTTGVPQPMPGGQYTPAPGRAPISLAAAS
ncbi:MAG TPA: anhydro-N-acetylmuramic acid kinase [Alphaproteobacteria bacterium]|nr:anhydro-N-acetylmuramic acid kinase [Alphaproteobacteria bacterium]